MEFTKEIHNGVEFRFDPLTNHQTRINPARAKRLMQSASHPGTIKEWINSTKHNCPFCPERITEATPCFPSDFCKEERFQSGATYIFPNLNPFSLYHAVATLSPQHHLSPDQFDEALLTQNLRASRDYFLKVSQYDPSARYPIFLWNYLPPSAGSIIHPHVQLMVERTPIPELAMMLEKSKAYFEKGGKNYWEELIEKERSLGERYIGRINDIHLITSYAPRGFREVTIIMKGISSFTDVHGHTLESLAHCMSTILKGYHSMGVGSFNMVSFSAAVNEHYPFYTLHFKVISRPYPQGIYTNDSGPFERFYDVWVIDTLPEEVAEILRQMF